MGIHSSSPCVMTNTDQFYVKICGCGAVHLNFGCAIVNVSYETAIAITETLREVSVTLRSQIVQADPVNTDQATLDDSGNVIFGRFRSNST